MQTKRGAAFIARPLVDGEFLDELSGESNAQDGAWCKRRAYAYRIGQDDRAIDAVRAGDHAKVFCQGARQSVYPR